MGWIGLLDWIVLSVGGISGFGSSFSRRLYFLSVGVVMVCPVACSGLGFLFAVFFECIEAARPVWHACFGQVPAPEGTMRI